MNNNGKCRSNDSGNNVILNGHYRFNESLLGPKGRWAVMIPVKTSKSHFCTIISMSFAILWGRPLMLIRLYLDSSLNN